MEPGCRPRGTRRLGEPRYLRLGAAVEYLFAPDFFGHDAAVDTPQSGTRSHRRTSSSPVKASRTSPRTWRSGRPCAAGGGMRLSALASRIAARDKPHQVHSRISPLGREPAESSTVDRRECPTHPRRARRSSVACRTRRGRSRRRIPASGSCSGRIAQPRHSEIRSRRFACECRQRRRKRARLLRRRGVVGLDRALGRPLRARPARHRAILYGRGPCPARGVGEDRRGPHLRRDAARLHARSRVHIDVAPGSRRDPRRTRRRFRLCTVGSRSEICVRKNRRGRGWHSRMVGARTPAHSRWSKNTGAQPLSGNPVIVILAKLGTNNKLSLVRARFFVAPAYHARCAGTLCAPHQPESKEGRGMVTKASPSIWSRRHGRFCASDERT